MIAISTNQSRTLKLWLPGRVVPKARPRFYGGNISLTRNYRGWKNKSNRARSSASFKRMGAVRFCETNLKGIGNQSLYTALGASPKR